MTVPGSEGLPRWEIGLRDDYFKVDLTMSGLVGFAGIGLISLAGSDLISLESSGMKVAVTSGS